MSTMNPALQIRKRSKRRHSGNNENLEPIDIIDLTVDSPIRQPQRPKSQNIIADVTIDLSMTLPEPVPSSEPVGESVRESVTVRQPVPEPAQQPVVESAPRIICPICYETLTDSMKPTATKCGHIFCENCLKNSLKMKKKCPKCRTNITRLSCTRVHFDFNN